MGKKNNVCLLCLGQKFTLTNEHSSCECCIRISTLTGGGKKDQKDYHLKSSTWLERKETAVLSGTNEHKIMQTDALHLPLLRLSHLIWHKHTHTHTHTKHTHTRKTHPTHSYQFQIEYLQLRDLRSQGRDLSLSLSISILYFKFFGMSAIDLTL